ncbi:PREDICTED: XK-related protein 8 [Gekko japonicus]|uniref:XK-related protein n=1 Tax=Gekko japonicus TaxID=146911 RepID=A0ABM1KK96_GEKJA|nr:PREDICTED: XK-related protein 8 [Gekko japonicus]
MAWSGCGPKCIPPWTPRYRYLDLLFALMGTAAFLVDLAADVWVAASYLQAGHCYWGGLVLGLLGLSSLTTQLFSWAWYRGDAKELRRDQVTDQTLLTLHFLQLGYLYRCLHALKVGFQVCRKEAPTEAERGYAVFLSHDISLLRLFETFLESAPQLTLGLYIILHTSKAETFQTLGICTSFVCIAWTLLDYHQSLRIFLRDKHKLGILSSAVYFLWNFLLVCPRILSLALFTVLFPSYIFLHFLGVWAAMFLWVTLQGTDFMEHASYEWLYRAVVAVVLYFCWFNVAEGKTRFRSAIYYTFLMLDSALLTCFWVWHNLPLSWDSPVLYALLAALPCNGVGILLRCIYYRSFHPTLQTASLASYDEVDTRGLAGDDAAVSQPEVVTGPINQRTYKLSQSLFASLSQDIRGQQNGAFGNVSL